MDPAAVKQQIVERVKQANNILVTVSANPSVDQLAACIGLTLLLNRMEKHATAVFSGIVPSTIEFLQPDKTIETNTDSLQDFIISLDKNKADKLRYKVENDVVRIFITPYKTSLSQADLNFSQGDFNVDVVMALGIADKTHIDAAITAHGRILHDATVISLMAGPGKSDVGQMNWQDATASSLCEMIVSISEAFGTGLIDNQMATAFLTGIVAETKRFSTARTTPKAMTMSAQLMAAGANQQLIVSKLEPPVVAAKPWVPKSKPQEAVPTGPKPKPAQTLDGTLNVAHGPAKKDSPEVAINPSEIHIDEQGNLSTADSPVPTEPAKAAPTPEPSAPASVTPTPPAPTPQAPPPGPHTLLDPRSYQPTMDTPFTANTQPEWETPYNSAAMDPLSTNGSSDQDLFKHNNPVKPPDATPVGNSPDQPDLDRIRNAVESAIDTAPFDPADHPIKALNANPINLDPPSTEPSLPLPGVSAPAPTPPAATPEDPNSVKAPPGPPPITLPSVPPIPSNNQSS